MSVSDVVCDLEPHLLKFRNAEDVVNPFLVDPTLNETKMPLLVGRSGTCIAIPK